jgi:signal transduction histidine kinase
MIAHELKQPVASIINFSAALSVRLGGLLKAHPECAAGLCTIRAESERISEIISRVRQYAKHRRCLPRRVPCRQLSAKQCLFIETAKAGVFRWR